MFEIDPQRRATLAEQWAAALAGRGLCTPAIFLLEAHKPLAGVVAHTLLAGSPLVRSLANVDCAELAAFLRDPLGVEMLVQRLEALRDVGSEPPARSS